MIKKKILHLITGLELGGGAENMLLQLLPMMQKDLDNRVCTIKGRGEIAQKLEEKGIRVYYLDLKNIFDLGILFRYWRVAKEFKPDVQVNYLIHADIFGRAFGRMFGFKKIVSYIRNVHKNRKILMFFDRITLFLVDYVLTNSETSKQYYIERMGVNENKIMCIPNGIDLARFENLKVNRDEKKKEIGIPEKSMVIGCVARLEKQKDIPTLVRAFHLINERHADAYLLLVGHGSEKENIKNLAKELGIAEKVYFLEKRSDIPELFQIMDIFVLPSLNEGMSNALLEAMASRKIIITSDIEENKELIENNRDGFNFKAGNSLKLAEQMIKIIERKYIEKKMEANALNKIKLIYDIAIIKNEFENFLK